jgi:flagellar assembly protein FliH
MGPDNILRKEDVQEVTPIPFQFDDIQALAKKILQKANAQAQRTLDAANKQAQAIEQTAYDDGQKRGYEDGHKKGLEEGRAAGDKAAREEVRAASETLAASLGAMLEELHNERIALQNSAEADLLKLALDIARRVVKREVALEEGVARENVAAAIALTVTGRDLTLLVNEADLASVEEHLPDLRRQFDQFARISIRADESVSRGGVRAVTSEGEVDLRVEEQLSALERALLGGTDAAPPAGT